MIALHVVPVWLDIVGLGLTVIVTVNGAPVVQVPDVGVTLYVTDSGMLELLFSVPSNELRPAPEPPPVTPTPDGAAHAYVVPTGTAPTGG